MELEVVLSPRQAPEEGRVILSELMEKLGVNESDLVPCAYADLLLSMAAAHSGTLERPDWLLAMATFKKAVDIPTSA